MNLPHFLTSCLLMQSINILSDNSIQLSLLLHFRQFLMRIIRLESPTIQILSKIGKKYLGLLIQTIIAEQILRFILPKFTVLLII